MAINSISQMNRTLKSYDVENWSKNIELKEGFNFRSEFPELNESSRSDKSFGEFLADSIGKVNQLQQNANLAMEKVASGESKNLHETLLAIEKADIAFRQMNQVRMKVIDAYKEIMKMQM
jgi:flagellar hook-basal body complex protein FliE